MSNIDHEAARKWATANLEGALSQDANLARAYLKLCDLAAVAVKDAERTDEPEYLEQAIDQIRCELGIMDEDECDTGFGLPGWSET